MLQILNYAPYLSPIVEIRNISIKLYINFSNQPFISQGVKVISEGDNFYFITLGW